MDIKLREVNCYNESIISDLWYYWKEKGNYGLIKIKEKKIKGIYLCINLCMNIF